MDVAFDLKVDDFGLLVFGLMGGGGKQGGVLWVEMPLGLCVEFEVFASFLHYQCDGLFGHGEFEHFFVGDGAVGACGGGAVFLKDAVEGVAVEFVVGQGVAHGDAVLSVVEGVEQVGEGACPGGEVVAVG